MNLAYAFIERMLGGAGRAWNRNRDLTDLEIVLMKGLGQSIVGNMKEAWVNVMEVEHLIDALKGAGKKFEYKIYQNAPGGHEFNRIDTALARQSRQEVYAFLAKYLK